MSLKTTYPLSLQKPGANKDEMDKLDNIETRDCSKFDKIPRPASSLSAAFKNLAKYTNSPEKQVTSRQSRSHIQLSEGTTLSGSGQIGCEEVGTHDLTTTKRLSIKEMTTYDDILLVICIPNQSTMSFSPLIPFIMILMVSSFTG